jgi:hypothetical protein
MPDRRRRYCKVCHRHDSEVGVLSWTGQCIDCAETRLIENNVSIHIGQGLGHERRRYAIIRKELGPRVALALKQAGMFGTVLDDMEESA